MELVTARKPPARCGVQSLKQEGTLESEYSIQTETLSPKPHHSALEKKARQVRLLPPPIMGMIDFHRERKKRDLSWLGVGD